MDTLVHALSWQDALMYMMEHSEGRSSWLVKPYWRFCLPITINGAYNLHSSGLDVIEGLVFVGDIPDTVSLTFNGTSFTFPIESSSFLPKGFFLPLRQLRLMSVEFSVHPPRALECYVVGGIHKADIHERRLLIPFSHLGKTYKISINSGMMVMWSK